MIGQEYLAHHGILGMKWGKKNGPPYPLAPSDHSASEKKAGWKKSLSAESEETARRRKELEEAVREFNAKPNSSSRLNDYRYAKKKFDDSLMLDKIRAQKVESKRQKELYSAYLKEGKTEEDAKIAAYKRAKAEKIMLITAGVSIAAIATYVAVNEYDKRVDKFIDVNQEMKRVYAVVNGNEPGIYNGMYVAVSERDQNKYLGMYARQLQERHAQLTRDRGVLGGFGAGGMMYRPADIKQQSMIPNSEGIKVASEKKASSIFKELMANDPEFKKSASAKINSFTENFKDVGVLALANKQGRLMFAATAKIKMGIIDDSVYRAFNMSMSGGVGGKDTTGSVDAFLNRLRLKGYGAIEDINDKHYSGYHSRSSFIIADSDKVINMGARWVSRDEIESKNKPYRYKLLAKQGALFVGSSVGGMVATSKLMTAKQKRSISDSAQKWISKHPNSGYTKGDVATMLQYGRLPEHIRQQRVAEYKKEHPNTKLSDRRIEELVVGNIRKGV